MADTFTKKKRSEIMSRIRSKHTIPELTVRKILNTLSFKFRLHVVTLPGKPDFSNKKEKIAIFVNGCFWHQHKNCKRNSIPKTNKAYWLPKLQKNILKQKKDIHLLKSQNWKIVIIWECQTQNIGNLSRKLAKELWRN